MTTTTHYFAGFLPGGLPGRRTGRPSSFRTKAAIPRSPASLLTASRSSSETGIRRSAVAGICRFLFGMARNHTRSSLARKPGGVITNCSKVYIANHRNVYYYYGMNNANTINLINHISGPRFTLLMRRNATTIRDVAQRLNVSQDRVRIVRERGVRGHIDATAWVEAVCGTCRFNYDYHTRQQRPVSRHSVRRTTLGTVRDSRRRGMKGAVA